MKNDARVNDISEGAAKRLFIPMGAFSLPTEGCPFKPKSNATCFSCQMSSNSFSSLARTGNATIIVPLIADTQR